MRGMSSYVKKSGFSRYRASRSSEFGKEEKVRESSIVLPLEFGRYCAASRIHPLYGKDDVDLKYFVEFDDKFNDVPHFHLHKMGLNARLVNGSRTKGVGLESGFVNGLIYKDSGNSCDGNDVNDYIKDYVLSFVEDNRKTLFLVYEALKSKKLKKLGSLDEIYQIGLDKIFTKNELASIERRYEKLSNNCKQKEFD